MIHAIASRSTARTAGFFFLVTIVTGLPAQRMFDKLLMHSSAAAAARNILTNGAWLRAALASSLVGTVCYVAVTALFYELFKGVSRKIALAAAIFSIAGCAVAGVSGAFLVAALAVSKAEHYLSSFVPLQLQSLSMVFVRLRDQTETVGIVFFGFYCLAIGYLIFRSTFLPRTLGVLMALAGLGWLTMLCTPLASALSPYHVFISGVLGEGSLTFWLLAIGVDSGRWNGGGV